MKYAIVKANSIKDLEDKVNDYLNQGWEPQGSMVITQSLRTMSFGSPAVPTIEYLQTVILDEYVSKLNVARCPY